MNINNVGRYDMPSIKKLLKTIFSYFTRSSDSVEHKLQVSYQAKADVYLTK